MGCKHAQQRGTELNTGHVLQSGRLGRCAGYDSQSYHGRFDRIVMVVSAHGYSGITGDFSIPRLRPDPDVPINDHPRTCQQRTLRAHPISRNPSHVPG
jgi:hypothetical protein